MAKNPNPRQYFPDLPPAPEPYPGSERFGDWSFGEEGNVVVVRPGELLPLDPRDPNKFPDYGEHRPKPKRRKRKG